jgi:metal-dependent amidase/aminoacylase/carboxypeptidase family protein
VTSDDIGFQRRTDASFVCFGSKAATSGRSADGHKPTFAADDDLLRLT